MWPLNINQRGASHQASPFTNYTNDRNVNQEIQIPKVIRPTFLNVDPNNGRINGISFNKMQPIRNADSEEKKIEQTARILTRKSAFTRPIAVGFNPAPISTLKRQTISTIRERQPRTYNLNKCVGYPPSTKKKSNSNTFSFVEENVKEIVTKLREVKTQYLWTFEEKVLIAEGLMLYNENLHKIAEHMGHTKTLTQIRNYIETKFSSNEKDKIKWISMNTQL